MSTNADESSLDPDEPYTPPWFTFLGICLFLVGGIFLLATEGDEEESVAPPEAAAEAAIAPPPTPPPAQEKAADPHAGHNH